MDKMLYKLDYQAS